MAFASEEAAAILQYWFGDAPAADAAALESRMGRWYGGGPGVDAEVTSRFGALVRRAVEGGLEEWERELSTRLALVLLLDQFTRNVFRDSPEMYAGDPRAQRLAVATRDCGELNDLSPEHRLFMIMPLLHAEDLELQERAVREMDAHVAAAPPELRPVFAAGQRQARKYRDVIARFGRFPHRNAILGRTSTEEELAFLREWQQRS